MQGLLVLAGKWDKLCFLIKQREPSKESAHANLHRELVHTHKYSSWICSHINIHRRSIYTQRIICLLPSEERAKEERLILGEFLWIVDVDRESDIYSNFSHSLSTQGCGKNTRPFQRGYSTISKVTIDDFNRSGWCLRSKDWQLAIASKSPKLTDFGSALSRRQLSE